MQDFNLQAISPIDGRYASKTTELSTFFSEFALIRYRVFVEIEYFIELVNIPLPELTTFPAEGIKKLRSIFDAFDVNEAAKVKKTESVTNHDVKAVEYYLKEKFDAYGWGAYKEFIHFGLTSQDINNTAVPLSLIDSVYKSYLPLLYNLMKQIKSKAVTWRDIPMLARTHGQPASPTRLGKELMVFIERLENQTKALSRISIQAKFGGATGNFNAHSVAYPDIDWIEFSNKFLQRIGLERQQFTTQIEHYDMMAALFDNMKRINTILLDFSRDIWTYVSRDYFKQKIKANEVGSSAMPHKVNPIDFENAEGNLGLSNALLEHLSAKLPISRLQRDLTDSTVTRNIGLPFGYIAIAIKSLNKGIDKLELNEAKIKAELEDNWAVVAEAIQTVLRKHNYPNPYEALKQLTRTNKKIDQAAIQNFIEHLEIDSELKNYLRSIRPENYFGINPAY